MMNETLWPDREGDGSVAGSVITLSVGLSREARKLLARLRSLLKLRNLLRLESTGGLVRSGESEGMAVFRIEDSGWVSWEESREREEDTDEEEKNDEEENDEGDTRIEQVDVISINHPSSPIHTGQHSLTN